MESCPSRPARTRLPARLCLAAALIAPGLQARDHRAAVPVDTARQTAASEVAPAAQEAPGTGAEVRIVARRQERAGERVFAAGDVEVRCGELLLLADRVEYDLETKDLLAEGDVVLQTGGQVIRAERARYNLGSGRGTVERASGLVAPTILFEAETLERRRADLFGLGKSRLTPCTQPNPRWSFALSRAELESGDHIAMWDAVLRIKNVPVFYLPYIRYPLKERATGFLLPQIGLSGDKGFSVSQSFYWAMAPNMDATVGVDLYLSRGLGAGLEYRYLFPGGTKGDLNLYHFIYKKEAGNERPGSSSIVRLDHTQALPLGFTLTANIDYQTSYAFLQEFDNDFQRALSFTRTTQVFLSRSWRGFNLSARASRFETYFSRVGDANVSTSLPQLTFNVFKTRLIGPVFFSLATSLTRSQYGWKSEYEAGTERRSSRLAVSPALSVPFHSIPWLTATTTVKANLGYYGQSLDPATGGIVDEPLFTRNFAASVEVVGPVVYRLFYGRDGRPRLKNIVEPFLNYSYDSPTNASDRIVTAYGFFRYHQMSYGVTSRFLFKGDADQAVEVFSLALGQTYYFSPEDGPLSRFPVDGRPPRFSEMTGALRFYPRALFNLDVSAAYNPYYDDLSNLRLSAAAGRRGQGNFLAVNWTRSRNSWLAAGDPELVALYNRDQIGAFGGLRLPRLDLDVQLQADYNIKDRKLLYTGARLTYHYQCVDILIDIRTFHYRVPADTQVRVSLGLGAIGRSLDFLGGFGF